jgi:hypothetical protein
MDACGADILAWIDEKESEALAARGNFPEPL